MKCCSGLSGAKSPKYKEGSHKAGMSFAPQRRTQHYINGAWVDSIDAKTFPTYNPETEEKICDVQEAGPKDVDAAVKAARTAFKSWRDVSGPKRRDLMLKLADLLETHKQALAEVESLDNGKVGRCEKNV